jgi:hypothetical protein
MLCHKYLQLAMASTTSSFLWLRYLVSDDAYPIKSCLYSYLRPWDIVKLSYVLKISLTKYDRDKYLNLLDDIFPDTRIISLASKLNIQISIFGNSLPLLKRRLEDPQDYFHKNGEDREMQHSPLFVVLLGQVGTPQFPRNRLVYELPDNLTFELSNSDAQLLTKWFRVEPFCSVNESSLQERRHVSLVHPKWTYQEDFWWDPFTPEVDIPSSALAKSSNSQSSSGVLSYFGFSLYLNIRSANVPEHLCSQAIQISDNYFTFHSGRVVGHNRLETTSFSAVIPPYGTRHELYPQVYNEGTIICFPLENDRYIDIRIPNEIIGVWYFNRPF